MKVNEMNALGERLKEARQRKGWSQTHVCDKLKISNSRLSGYERNYREPDTKMLTTLASLYQVSIDWLTGLSDEPGHSLNGRKKAPSFKNKELQSWYENLPFENEKDLNKLKKIWDILSSQ
ncbi:helix-turn-helix domain-containing protein [Halobacillus sp. A5]|uniref:helix-turn-helix domain-containing protein n=1 Tax=Halobacillus sp. A5 TaxID=2880263 RepID=UPI0020A66564|nr:helix-turn-helix transcriptional regulator [Halobacillus sp. A5]MCP3026889.1 helix-turn-helix domain-containing protein [Halobacillus sp. A5]